jgi:hypothetical protein
MFRKYKRLLYLLYSSLILATTSTASAQTDANLPYKKIPAYPAAYTPGAVIARTIDGLGYRYYWATEGLREVDVAYAPSADARSSRQTLEHIYSLSLMVLQTARNEAFTRPEHLEALNLEDLREQTLRNIEMASTLFLPMQEADVEQLAIFFNAERKLQLPLWHLLNGPLADALYHTGQVVSFRRSSGNPMNPKVNVFMGNTGD